MSGVENSGTFRIVQGEPDADGKLPYLYKEQKLNLDGKWVDVRTVEQLTMISVLNAGIGAVRAQDEALATLYSQMTSQTETLTDINDVLQELNTLKQTLRDGGGTSGTLSADAQKKLQDLINNKLVSVADGFKVTDGLTLEGIETLQSNLSTAQSSQSALNEDLSLKLNQAASSRAAVFTQLQTLLQTFMQTMMQLSRF